MSVTYFTRTFGVGGVLTDVTSAVITIVRTDTSATIVNAAAMTNISTGVYQYALTDPAYDLTYDHTEVLTYDGAAHTFNGTLVGSVTPSSSLVFLTVAEADTYFATRLGASEFWASGTEKEAALGTAERQIVATDRWTFDAPASGEDYDDEIKYAVCEQALFLLVDTDSFERTALQTQGVVEAGIVAEKYLFNKPDTTPIAQTAVDLLRPYRKRGYGFVYTNDE